MSSNEDVKNGTEDAPIIPGLEGLSFRDLVTRMEPAFPEEVKELLNRWGDLTTDLMQFMQLTEMAWFMGFSEGRERHAYPVTPEALKRGYTNFLKQQGIIDGPEEKDSGIITLH